MRIAVDDIAQLVDKVAFCIDKAILFVAQPTILLPVEDGHTSRVHFVVTLHRAEVETREREELWEFVVPQLILCEKDVANA